MKKISKIFMNKSKNKINKATYNKVESQLDLEDNIGEKVLISIVSDTHVLPESMIADSQDFKDDLASDRKFFVESQGLFNAAMDIFERRSSDLIFVTGDLTKDGEYLSHKFVSDKLKTLAQGKEGRRIYVIPGNHDLNNVDAMDYNFDGQGHVKAAKRTSPVDFMEIYNEIVYSKAINLYKDTDYFRKYLSDINTKYDRKSPFNQYAHGYTSYVSRFELDGDNPDRKGITIIGLDTVKCSIESVKEGIDGVQNTAGCVSNAQFSWLIDMSEEAKARGDLILLLSHHAFMPHFNQQEKVLKEYIISNWNLPVSSEDKRIDGKKPYEILADNGIHFMFSGHMHAQDIAKATSRQDNILYDIETGSTVTYPLPIRHVLVSRPKYGMEINRELNIFTEHISQFKYTGLTGKEITIDNAGKYAHIDLLTHDLMKSLFNYLLPKDINIRKIIESSLGPSDDLDKAILLKLMALVAGKEGAYYQQKNVAGIGDIEIFIYREEARENEEAEPLPRLVINVKTRKKDLFYKIQFNSMKLILTNLLNQFDETIFNNREHVDKIIDKVSKELFNVVIYVDNGNDIVVSEVINETYLTHLRGDEQQSEAISQILEKYEKNNVVYDVLKAMENSFNHVLYDIGRQLYYTPSIKEVLESSEKSIFSSLVRKQITGKFGKNMKDTMKGLGINTAFIYEKLLGSGLFEYYMVKGNEMILQLVYDMTSEENPQYSDYMYLEDNNTTLRLD